MENHKKSSEYMMSAFHICREEVGEWKWSSETMGALTFFEQKKMNTEKYVALIVLSYEQREGRRAYVEFGK